MFQAGTQVTVLEARQRCYMPRLAFGFPRGVVQEFDVATRTYTVLPADSGRPQTRILEWAVVAHVDNSVEAQTRNGQLSGVGAKLVVEAQHRADAAEAESAAATEARQGRLVLATGFSEYCGCPVGLLRAAKKPKRLIFLYIILVSQCAHGYGHPRRNRAVTLASGRIQARQGRLVLATEFVEYAGCPVGLLRAAKKPKRLIFFIYYISVK